MNMDVSVLSYLVFERHEEAQPKDKDLIFKNPFLRITTVPVSVAVAFTSTLPSPPSPNPLLSPNMTLALSWSAPPSSS